jgi:hypothetical protein
MALVNPIGEPACLAAVLARCQTAVIFSRHVPQPTEPAEGIRASGDDRSGHRAPPRPADEREYVDRENAALAAGVIPATIGT